MLPVVVAFLWCLVINGWEITVGVLAVCVVIPLISFVYEEIKYSRKEKRKAQEEREQQEKELQKKERRRKATKK